MVSFHRLSLPVLTNLTTAIWFSEENIQTRHISLETMISELGEEVGHLHTKGLHFMSTFISPIGSLSPTKLALGTQLTQSAT